MADTLHNLAETLSKMGRYDQSLARYLRALDLRRKSGDRRGAAIESYSIGTIFDYQGRYGAAVKSKEEALAAFRDLKQRDMWLGEILGGYGNSLALERAVRRRGQAARRGDDRRPRASESDGRSRRRRDSRPIGCSTAATSRRRARAPPKRCSRRRKASDRSLALLAQASAATVAVAAQPSQGARRPSRDAALGTPTRSG